MQGSTHLQAVSDKNPEVPMQTASIEIWDQKYRLKTKDGTILDRDIDGTWKRVAIAPWANPYDLCYLLFDPAFLWG